MTHTEVNAFIDANQDVLGQVVQGKEVTHLFAAPNDSEIFAEIVKSILLEEDYSRYFVGQNDFNAYVIYNGNDPYSDLLLYELLESHLQKQGL